MAVQAVRHSRAGDVFHYRWAARRCLALVEPNTSLKKIVVEGSTQPTQPGEYAIDLTECYEEDGVESFVYFQLKHSTVRTGQEFSFSELKPTLRSFAERFVANLSASAKQRRMSRGATFWIVTNRLVAASFKTALTALRHGGNDRSRAKFERATGLKGNRLRDFCAAFSINDSEGNYLSQKESLQAELGSYLAGPVRDHEAEGIIALVSDRALPGSDGIIQREDVLSKLGVTHPRQLFPAPAQFDAVDAPIVREQQDGLLQTVLTARHPVIIHAAGGVGKSVVAWQLVRALPAGSWGLMYDCFGGGNYRNISLSRHRIGEALVQMANEMAVAGLCRMLVPSFRESAKEIMLAFLERLQQAVATLRASQPGAQLVLFIDAADNAQMAAAEAGGDLCFARVLLRENLPEGCRLVALCRTERIGLLEPPSNVVCEILPPFSPEETGAYLHRSFPEASPEEIQEFHRLSGANPRVQATVLAAGHATVSDLLTSLGPTVLTSDAQIAAQLKAAIAKLRDAHPKIYGIQIEAICCGLANLPPFIPLEILAAAASVDEGTIRSFVSDLGRPLWLSDHAVQFRDEPTETWFNHQFRAEPAQVRRFIEALEPLASDSAYAARCLPALLHRADEHDRLIALALSDQSLPTDSPIDARDIRLYRLQFAFKAALQLGRKTDACRLALRAGEEVAGDHRQMELLIDHVDLIPRLQSQHRVQELAYRGTIAPSDWRGSANVHSAALLSGVEDFWGEARSYLRGAERWLELTSGEQAEPELAQAAPHENDFLAFAWAHCNLAGPAAVATFFLRAKASTAASDATWTFARRLVDAGRFDELIETARLGAKKLDLLLVATDELLPFGKTPPEPAVRQGLASIAREGFRIDPTMRYDSGDRVAPAVLSLCEAAATHRIPAELILAALDKCTAAIADGSVAADYRSDSRRNFLRGAALRAFLAGAGEPVPDALLPKREQNSPAGHGGANHDKALRETLAALLPWYYLRVQTLARDPAADAVGTEQLRNRAKTALHGRFMSHDHLPFEMSSVHFEVLAFKKTVTPQELEFFERRILARAEQKISLSDRLGALRLAARLEHLQPLRGALEDSVRGTVGSLLEEGPDELARWYVGLARAVLAENQTEAAAYFDLAVEAVSKFGDEIGERWEAVVTVGHRAAETGTVGAALTYRFVQCGEIVGRSVGREKYWDRDEVFRVAARLHLPTAFAALSRWRDREVGRFGYQLRALAGEAVGRGFIAPACAWGFTGFLGCNAVADFAGACLEHEKAPDVRRQMLRAAIHDLTLDEAGASEFEKLARYASEFAEEKKRLDEILEALAAGKPEANPPTPPPRRTIQDDRAGGRLQKVDVFDADALGTALVAMKHPYADRNFGAFWDEVIGRVPRGQETRFLDVFIGIPGIDCQDAGLVVARLRQAWLRRPSVARKWKPFLSALGERLAHEFADRYRLDGWAGRCAATGGEAEAVMEGMIRGLAGSVETLEASDFFGFVAAVTGSLTPEESRGLLDFALSRMELHIPAGFGDGPWSERLHAGEAAHHAVAGLVWSALGSPYSSMRWEAAHCVRRWADLGCTALLGALLDWMEQDTAGAYASQSYPFYHLHARLYLLIALVRVSVEQPALLRAHSQRFAAVALQGLPHILIQKTAADIALRIEQASPGTFPAEQADRLRRVGLSPFAMVPRPPARPRLKTQRREPTENLAPFGQEFAHHWFDQIGDVFGVPKQDVIGVARRIAVQQFGVDANEPYLCDPRQEQWNAADHGERSTSHRHGSYPRNDTYGFYVSYHSFLYAASDFLARVPVLTDPDGWHGGDRWADFTKKHLLTRCDGRWLADRRDPAPLRRRSWVHLPRAEPWEKSLRDEDFVDVLTRAGGPAGFLCVYGAWTDHVSYHVENISVQSALVNPATAASLANSLRSVEDSHHFFLPTYECEDAEHFAPPFELVGWVLQDEGGDPRLDRFDPHAKNIIYPPLGVGASFAAALGLLLDAEGREWRQGLDAATPAVVSEVWSNQSPARREEACRSGQRLGASVDVLKQLCRQTGKDLILCAEIKRTLHRSTHEETQANGQDSQAFKIFLFSHDGALRGAEGSYRIG